MWTAEAYGSDAITPLAYLAAHTERIRLGTGVMQVAARTPAATAMQLGTLDALAGGGRVIGGLGVSGPQIVEGWYGQPWGHPNAQLRDYVAILRKIFAREAPVAHDGAEISLPYRGPGASGLGKPLKSILHTNRAPALARHGRAANVILTAEIADGWLPLGFVPGKLDHYRPALEEGFRRAGGKSSPTSRSRRGRRSRSPTTSRRRSRSRSRSSALYVGGMGDEDENFHKKRWSARAGARRPSGSTSCSRPGAATRRSPRCPTSTSTRRRSSGPRERIRERWRAWEDSGATGLTVRTQQDEAFELMAELAGAGPPR